ncbi:MAG: HAD family hydrolase, partial [Planctomycetota bacterium]
EDHWIRCGRGIDAFVLEHNLSADPQLIRRRKARRYERLVSSGVKTMPGARELLCSLRGKKPMGLATSSYEKDAYAVLGELALADFFCCVATKEDVERIKPHPDLFLYVADKMEATPEHCLVIEDAEKGVVAAAAAGMKCIAVPNSHTRTNDFSKATMIVDSLEKITCELIDQL